ncbi:MAG: deoxyribodipyrimidine photo-lyase, partial [Sphingomonadaceae bacterium]|nr:deoxyribodipyrimidine photo-lyase [Sphingomonadaceae bacterium]
MTKPQILWLRRDLRLADQPALVAALAAGPVLPVYVLDDEAAKSHAYGGASRWWLHHSLESLARDLGKHNVRLILRRGDAVEELCKLAEEVGADTIHAIRHYEPWWRKAQGELAKRLTLELYDGNYLLPPGAVTTGSGSPYKIYTPFSRATLEQMPLRDCLPAPEHFSLPDQWPASDALEDWTLLPMRPDWAGGMREYWQVGEAAALERLEDFADRVARYDDDRNLPSLDGSSFLSPHLHFGEISPAQVWHALKGEKTKGWEVFAKELIWRDYAQNVICQFPRYPLESYREEFEQLAWRDPGSDPQAAADLAAWQQGRTGYPIVDAGMRQLWQTGWMHNR